MVSPVTPAPNTVTRMATMVLRHGEKPLAVSGGALSRQIVMSREVAESERTGVVPSGHPVLQTRFFAGWLRCLCGESVPPTLWWNWKCSVRKRVAILWPASKFHETRDNLSPALDGRIYLHMSAICWPAACAPNGRTRPVGCGQYMGTGSVIGT